MRFDQVKLLAADISLLSAFYVEALECVIVVPEQATGLVVARGAGVPDAEVTITVLRLPGHGDHGPELELYSVNGPRPGDWHYQPGQGQLAFEVEDMELEQCVGKVVDAGGRKLGEIVEWQGPSGSVARFLFMQDPEGNVIDLWCRV